MRVYARQTRKYDYVPISKRKTAALAPTSRVGRPRRTFPVKARLDRDGNLVRPGHMAGHWRDL